METFSALKNVLTAKLKGRLADELDVICNLSAAPFMGKLEGSHVLHRLAGITDAGIYARLNQPLHNMDVAIMNCGKRGLRSGSEVSSLAPRPMK